jgi:diketogulonate reductase-like aldo/keto reductase
METTETTLTLNNGVQMPALGLGVFQTPPDETRDAVRAALDAGYRHVDTAAAYGNERQVAEAVHSSDLDRSQVFLKPRSGSATTGTTKRCTASRRAPESSASTRSTC